jgi:DtxR family Mn-dependent transcriptional regulator
MRLHQAKRPPSAVHEDYLKQVLLLEAPAQRPGRGQKRSLVTNKALAERMAVQPSSVTRMLRRLSALGLLEYVPYAGVRLTERGRRIALEVSRHHRLLETYLHQVLGYSWEEVHAEAERLEHAMSEDLELRIAAHLGHPSRDPHGDPIPDPQFAYPPAVRLTPLSAMPRGRAGRLVRVTAQDRDTLNLLSHLYLVPGARVETVAQEPAGVRILVRGQQFLLPAQLTEAVWLEVEVE